MWLVVEAGVLGSPATFPGEKLRNYFDGEEKVSQEELRFDLKFSVWLDS